MVVVTTVANDEQVQKLAHEAVQRHLVACVQCIPIRSVYHWKGCVEDSAEIQLLMKTPVGRKDELVSWLSSNHPYETPEILVLSVQDVSSAYLAWAETETNKATQL